MENNQSTQPCHSNLASAVNGTIDLKMTSITMTSALYLIPLLLVLLSIMTGCMICNNQENLQKLKRDDWNMQRQTLKIARNDALLKTRSQLYNKLNLQKNENYTSPTPAPQGGDSRPRGAGRQAGGDYLLQSVAAGSYIPHSEGTLYKASALVDTYRIPAREILQNDP